VNHVPAGEKTETKTIEAKKDFAAGIWRQSLRISRVGSTIYLDEGNGAFSPRRGAGSPVRRTNSECVFEERSFF
jgi:hypothetical protein